MLDKIQTEAKDKIYEGNIVKLEDLVDICDSFFYLGIETVQVKSNGIPVSKFSYNQKDLFLDLLISCVGTNWEALGFEIITQLTDGKGTYSSLLLGRIPYSGYFDDFGF